MSLLRVTALVRVMPYRLIEILSQGLILKHKEDKGHFSDRGG